MKAARSLFVDAVDAPVELSLRTRKTCSCRNLVDLGDWRDENTLHFFSVLLFLGVLLSQAAASSFTELNKPGELLDGRGRAAVVEGVLPGRAALVFNLEVAHTHNFLVSDAGILVHNNCRDRKSARPEGDGAARRGAKQMKKLSKGEIKVLKDRGIDRHDLEPNSKFDLFKDKDGNTFVKPKNGAGPGDPTGINTGGGS